MSFKTEIPMIIVGRKNIYAYINAVTSFLSRSPVVKVRGRGRNFGKAADIAIMAEKQFAWIKIKRVVVGQEELERRNNDDDGNVMVKMTPVNFIELEMVVNK